jgi:hypothetical protein
VLLNKATEKLRLCEFKFWYLSDGVQDSELDYGRHTLYLFFVSFCFVVVISKHLKFAKFGCIFISCLCNLVL